MAVQTMTFPGFPGGTNLALPAHEIDDTEARIIQDALVDQPGITRRRGPMKGVSGAAVLTRKATGLVTTLDPQGADRYAALTGDASNGLVTAYSPDRTTTVDLAWPFVFDTNPPSAPYRWYDAKPGLKGGTFVGASLAFDAQGTPQQGLAYWGGGYRANLSSTLTVARGSANVSASAGLNVGAAPGMWVFASTDEGYTNTLIGQILNITSDTTFTLAAISPYALTAKAATIQSIRGIYPKVTTGRITCDVTSTQVNGGATNFISQGLGGGTWNIYRQSDLVFIGKVASVQSEVALTLTANAALAIVDDEYVAMKADGDWSISTLGNTSKVGWLNAVYASRQWFANVGAQQTKTSRVWFSDTNDPEALDVSEKGNWLEVVSTAMVNEPIRGLMPAYNSLLVFKENETFAIYGNSPSQFAVKKIHDDGCLSPMSVQSYGGGAIWVGREGIHFFDGLQVTNLTAQKLGQVWNNSIRTFDPSKYRIYSMLSRDHYWVFIENLQPTVAIVKGNVSTTPTYWGICINMVSRAFTFKTNVPLRGAVTLPAASGHHTYYIVNDSTKGVLCDADDLYDSEGADAFATDVGLLGPDMFIETKKFDVGDPMRLKWFRLFGLTYLIQGGSIKVDVVLGLNNIARTLTGLFTSSTFTWSSLHDNVSTWTNLKSQFPTWSDVIGSVYQVKRLWFGKRSQHISFRLYQDTNAVTRLKIGPYMIGFRPMRVARVGVA